MPRKRLISPEFFTHADLYDAEARCGLPLRLAFAGLWTQSDRRGLFRWRPRELKLAILPYDAVDFADVLSALEAEGFIQRYTVDGKEYGRIASFARWQSFHPHEKPFTDIPEPSNGGREPTNGRPGPDNVGASKSAPITTPTPTPTTVGGSAQADPTPPRARKPKPAPTPPPPAVLAAADRWTARVGAVTAAQITKHLTGALARHGEAAVLRAMDAYAAACVEREKPGKLEWFAQEVALWVERGAPLVDASGLLTDRGVAILSANGGGR